MVSAFPAKDNALKHKNTEERHTMPAKVPPPKKVKAAAKAPRSVQPQPKPTATEAPAPIAVAPPPPPTTPSKPLPGKTTFISGKRTVTVITLTGARKDWLVEIDGGPVGMQAAIALRQTHSRAFRGSRHSDYEFDVVDITEGAKRTLTIRLTAEIDDLPVWQRMPEPMEVPEQRVFGEWNTTPARGFGYGSGRYGDREEDDDSFYRRLRG